jgi:hypothetical protein
MTNAIHISGGHQQEGPRVSPPVPEEDGPAIMATTAPTANKDVGTYKTPSK